MRADVLIFAAGIGSRLKPITDKIPKPLVEVAGMTLLERNIKLVKNEGFKRLIVNVHYKKEMIIDFLNQNDFFGLEIVISEEKELLNTGGTIKNIEEHLQSEKLITINSDIILGEDFSLSSLLDADSKNSSLATLVLRNDPDSKKYGEVCLDQSGQIVSFLGKKYFDQEIVENLMYTGVQVMSKEVLDFMPEKGSIFSITQNTYLDLLEKGKKLSGLRYDGYWNDVGTHERLEQARGDFGC